MIEPFLPVRQRAGPPPPAADASDPAAGTWDQPAREGRTRGEPGPAGPVLEEPVPGSTGPVRDVPVGDRQPRDLHGLGPLAHLAGPDTTDLLVDGEGAVWHDGGHGLRRVREPAFDPAAARRLATALIAAGGRHLDDASPCVDVRLERGVRVHAVLPPVSTGGAVVSIRIGRRTPWRLADLVTAGALDADAADRVAAAVRGRDGLLICGPAGSGKTSLLAALLAEVPHDERIVTVEDVAELAVDHPHVIGLEARQPNADGAGGIDVGRLIRESLRMRPDRLVLGECRGAELADLLAAMNTGHAGGGTLHSSGLAEVPARLEALGALAGMTPEALCRQVLGAVDLVVHLERRSSGRVAVLGRLVADARGRLTAVPPPP